MRKKIIVSTLLLATLAGCNAGSSLGSNTAANSSVHQKFISQFNDIIKSSYQNLTINLSQSIYISPDETYIYKVYDLQGKEISSGEFKCQGVDKCNINDIYLNYTDSYLLSIFGKDSNNFIGGKVIIPQEGISYMYASIDDYSTSEYISQIIQDQLKDVFAMPFISTSLFKSALDYKPGTTMNTLVYAYYIFQTKANKLSHDDAIKKIVETYKFCEQGKTCSLDEGFIKNPQVVQNALDAASKVIDDYVKDKKDSAAYENYKWIKENFTDKFDEYKDPIKAGSDFFFPGAGGKVVDGAGSAFEIFGKGMDFATKSSKEAYDRVQLLDANLAKVYVSAQPNYNEIMKEIGSAALNEQTIIPFKKAALEPVFSAADINNSHLSGKSMEEYLVDNASSADNLDWIVSKYKNSGYFDSENTSDLSFALDKLVDDITIKDLGVAYKYVIDYKPNAGSSENVKNIIALRKTYNQAIINLLQRAVTALQYSMYLDTMSATIKYSPVVKKLAEQYPSISYVRNNATFIEKSISSTDYDDALKQIKSKYSARLTKLRQRFQSIIIAEKELVPEQVMQTLQVEGKCNINYYDGGNVYGAQCPVYYIENNLLKTKYIQSSLNRPNTKCATYDGSDNPNKIADVRNIYGKIGCLTTALSNKLVGDSLRIEPNQDVGFSVDHSLNNSFIFEDKATVHRLQVSVQHDDDFIKPSVYNVQYNSEKVPMPMSGLSHNIAVKFFVLESDFLGNNSSLNRRFVTTGVRTNYTSHSGVTAGTEPSVLYYYDKYMNGKEELLPITFDYNKGAILKIKRSSPTIVNEALAYKKKLDLYNLIDTNKITFGSFGYLYSILFSNNTDLISVTPVEVMPNANINNTKTSFLLKFKYNDKIYSRILLPGGEYDLETPSSTNIVMTNWKDWEVNPQINPYIPLDSAEFSGLSVWKQTSDSIPASCGDTDTKLKSQLIIQGRKEFATYAHTKGVNCGNLVHWSFDKTKTPIKFYAAQNNNDYAEFTAYAKLSNGKKCIQGLNSSVSCAGKPDNTNNSYYNVSFMPNAIERMFFYETDRDYLTVSFEYYPLKNR